MHRIARILAVAGVLVLDPDGYRHIVSSDLDDARMRPVGDLWYATDRGAAWSTQKLLEGDGWDLAWHHPAIAVDRDGSVHIAVVRAS